MTDLTHRIKALEVSEGSLRQQLEAAQAQATRLQQEIAEKGRTAAMSEAKRDSLQAELDQVSTCLWCQAAVGLTVVFQK